MYVGNLKSYLSKVNVQEETANNQLSIHLNILEDDVVSVRDDLERPPVLYQSLNYINISREFPFTSLSSTCIFTT